MKNHLLIGFGVFVVLFFTVGGHFIQKTYREYVQKHPEKYCYETFRNPDKPVNVVILNSLRKKDAYLEYYQGIKFGKEPFLPDGIPLKTVGYAHPVHVIKTSKDGSMAKIVTYHQSGFGGGTHLSGWVLVETLHETPPPQYNQK